MFVIVQIPGAVSAGDADSIRDKIVQEFASCALKRPVVIVMSQGAAAEIIGDDR